MNTAAEIGDEEDENGGRGKYFQEFAFVAFFEVFSHGGHLVFLGHFLDAVAQQPPDEQHAEQRVAQGDPQPRIAELPADFPGKADEYHR